MIDVVPGYLSCGIKLLTKRTESLIANVHKIPICAPTMHHPSAVTATGPPPPAEGSCACRREKQLDKPSTAMGSTCAISRLLVCCRQTSGGVSCGSRMWVKVRAGLQKKFTGGYQEQALQSHKYLNNCLESLGLDNAWRQDIFGWRVGFLCLPHRLCDGREFGRDPSNPLSRDVNESPPQTIHISPHLPSLHAVLPLLQRRQLLFTLPILTNT